MTIGLTAGTATVLAWVLLVGSGLAGIAIAFAPAPGGAGAGRVALRLLAITLVALCLRAAVSLLFDGGTYDIFFAYRKLGDELRHGGDVYAQRLPSLANYPPVIYWWWSLAATIVPNGSPHLFAALVRAPFWVVDAAIAPVLALLVRGRWRWRSAWLYALNPIAIAVPTLHGQFDSIPALCLLLAVAWLAVHPRRAAWLVGIGAAIKVWPAYFVPALLAGVRRAQWGGFIIRVLVPSVAAYALYFVVHPDHIVQGLVGVIAYVPHRQGLGTSLLFPASWGDPFIVPVDLVVAALVLWMVVQCARRDVAIVDIVALAMLIVLGLGPAISDQYLMWPMAILLLGGHRRIAALLSVAMTPATLFIDISSAGPATAVPPEAPLLATAATITAAAVLLREVWTHGATKVPGEQSRQTQPGSPAPARTAPQRTPGPGRPCT